jgi:hypothetical protein
MAERNIDNAEKINLSPKPGRIIGEARTAFQAETPASL